MNLKNGYTEDLCTIFQLLFMIEIILNLGEKSK